LLEAIQSGKERLNFIELLNQDIHILAHTHDLSHLINCGQEFS